jgi:hypothetical protein
MKVLVKYVTDFRVGDHLNGCTCIRVPEDTLMGCILGAATFEHHSGREMTISVTQNQLALLTNGVEVERGVR